MTWATAGFEPALLTFAGAEFDGEDPFAPGAVVGLTKTPTVWALFAGTALLAADACGTAFCFGSRLADLGAAAFTETAFFEGAIDALFAPAEIVFFGPATTGLTEPDFWTDVAGLVDGKALTETAGFAFGAALVALAFAPFGEGLVVCAV